MVADYMLEKYGMSLHIGENIIGGDKFANLDDLENPERQIKEYIDRVLKAFVVSSLDVCIDAARAGSDKFEAFCRTVAGSWPCIEAKTTGLDEFRLTNIPVDGNGPVATHDKDQALDQCIGREITALVAKNPDIEKWDEVAADVKKNLVGTVRPLSVFDPVGRRFNPLLGDTGKPVVKTITAEDVDKIGRDVMDVILEG